MKPDERKNDLHQDFDQCLKIIKNIINEFRELSIANDVSPQKLYKLYRMYVLFKKFKFFHACPPILPDILQKWEDNLNENPLSRQLKKEKTDGRWGSLLKAQQNITDIFDGKGEEMWNRYCTICDLRHDNSSKFDDEWQKTYDEM